MSDDIKKAKSQDAAELLQIHMRDISENHYCAGWLNGLEFTLWEILNGGDRMFGMHEVSDGDVTRLRDLHERSGGWWIWDDGERFLTTEEWLTLLRDRARDGGE